MAKYKVGDKVRIVSERPDSPAFADDMCKYLGQVVTIDKVLDLGKPSYKMREDKGKPEFYLPRLILGDIGDGWVWMEYWISGLADEAPKEASNEVYSVHLRFCGSLTVAELMKDGKVVKVANARCNLDDTYDRGEGAKVAVNRLFEKKRPDVVGKLFDVIGRSPDLLHFYRIGTVVRVLAINERGDYECEAVSSNPGVVYQNLRPKDLAPHKEAKK